MRRSNKHGAQKPYTSPVKSIYSYFKPHRVRKLAEEEVDLSAVGKLLQTIADASIDSHVALPRALLEIFVDRATNALTLFQASVPFFH